MFDEMSSLKDRLKGYLYEYVTKITTNSKNRYMFVCPLCGSGTGQNKTGAFCCKEDSTQWHCFVCGQHGDIYNLVGLIEGINNLPEQIKYVAEYFNEKIPDTMEPPYHHNKKVGKKVTSLPNIKEKIEVKQEKLDEQEDYTEFFNEAHSHIADTDYPKKRGLSEEVINRFNLGYVSNWKHPKAPNAPYSPRLIIPTSKYSYLARDTRSDIPAEQQQYTKSKVGHVNIFNINALYVAKKPIFVVEGEIDALSIIEAGGEAVALGSISMVNAFLDCIKLYGCPVQPILLALDNDKKGQEAQEKLINEIIQLTDNVKFNVANVAQEYKDPNDRLQQDRDGLKKAIVASYENLFQIQESESQGYRESNSVNGYLSDFINYTMNVDTPFIKTGFTTLDSILDGGLYEGLYVIGAISSLGKTSFILQMMDQIARSGEDVLIFSLEMARTELMAKSLSRLTLEIALTNDFGTTVAKTTRGITNKKRYQNYSKKEKEIIHTAINDYATYASNLFVFEGVGDIGVQQVREQIARHIKFTNKRPIVVIDYAQILAPYNERATDKQNVDKNILELKRISRDFKLSVIIISSFNRASYSAPVSMEAFKESGAVEYGSDVLFGLQLKGAGEKDFDVNKAKSENPRKVELVILKNRNGKTGDTIAFDYYPMFNYFEEKK